MKILLVNPSTLNADGSPKKYKKSYLPSLSLATLNSLTPAGHEVKIVDDIVEKIDFSSDYDLVGITAMSGQIGRAFQIADNFRKLKVKVVIGGSHVSILPDEAEKRVDSVAIGEVEDIWETIINDAENGKLKKRYKAEAFPDLQKLVIPKWDEENLKVYARQPLHKLPMMPIHTTRGCAFRCEFCMVHKYFGNAYRVKPLSNVLKEIEATNAENYFFVDDNIISKADYSKELFKALGKREKLNWFSQASSTILKSPDLIELAAGSGCRALFLGIESINDRSLKSMNKGFNKTARYAELFKRLRKAGIVPIVSLIVGFDEDNVEQLSGMLKFLVRNKITHTSIFILTPIPGTELYAGMEKDNRILSSDWSKYDGTNAVFQPKNFTVETLEQSYWKLYRKFFSLINSFRNIFINVRTAFNSTGSPFTELLTSSFLTLSYRKKVFNYEHPFSGGIGRIS